MNEEVLEEGVEPPPPTDFEEIPPEIPEEVAPVETEPELLCDSEIGKLLSQLVDTLEHPEKTARELMVRIWKKHENYWRDRQYIIWDEISQDWRTPTELKEFDNSLDIDPAAYAKVVNIYKAHGEAIISALSAGLPHVRFFPDDADSQDDVFTAKSYTKISELLQKRNKGQLLFIRALFLLYNSGTIFAYNENKDTTKFGTVKRTQTAEVPVINRQKFCPNCGFMMGSEQFDAPPPMMPPPMPGSEMAPPMGPEMGAPPMPPSPMEAPPMGPESVQGANGLPPAGPPPCPNCGVAVEPDFEDYEEIIPRVIGNTEEPKSHECIEVFGPLHVKMPLWVQQQSQTPYITLETEEDEAMLQDLYPEVADKITPSTDTERYERYGRENTDYRGDIPLHLCTLRRTWIRPWAYNRLGYKDHSEDIAKLKAAFPEGVYVVKINDLIAEAIEDRIDDHWTVNLNPLSNHAHGDPLSQSLIPVQDITNELTNLTLETIEFGIPETFYDSETIEQDAYNKSEARPGMLYPAKARPTMGLDSSFHTIKTATLGQEVASFSDKMTQAGQFVSGAMPTIWGGALEGSGGTAKEVENARAMSLQRLNLTWTMVKMWWADVMSKAVRSFAVNMKDDEKFVQSKGNNFVNVWIRQAEMNGKVGQVEADISEAFPVSWAQKRDILMGLINTKHPLVDTVLGHPENAGIVAATVGFPDLYIPGDDSRSKQLHEISILLQGQPMPMGMPGPDGQEALQPTVMPEKWENHIVEAETIKAWLNSEVGIETKATKPPAYMNVVAHLQAHEFFIGMEAEAEAENEEEDGEKESDNSNSNEGA